MIVSDYSFISGKDGSAQEILRYTIHERPVKWVVGALRDVSLKQARVLATQWRSVLLRGIARLKNAIKKSVKAMCMNRRDEKVGLCFCSSFFLWDFYIYSSIIFWLREVRCTETNLIY